MKKLLLALLVLAMSATSAVAQESAIKYELTPYAWASALDGQIGVRGITTDVDASFDDLFDILDTAVMVNFKAISDPWTLQLNVSYIELENAYDLPRSTLTFESDTLIFAAEALYELPNVPDMQLVLGGRYYHMDHKLQIVGGNELTQAEEWVDPIIGLIYTHHFTQRLSLLLRGDIGGFNVGSQFAWNALLSLNYRLTENLLIHGAYKHLVVDYDEDGFIYNADRTGLGIGITVEF